MFKNFITENDLSPEFINSKFMQAISIGYISTYDKVSGESFFNGMSHIIELFYNKECYLHFMKSNPDVFLVYAEVIDNIKRNANQFFDINRQAFIKNTLLEGGTLQTALESFSIPMEGFDERNRTELISQSNTAMILIPTEKLIEMAATFIASENVLDYQKKVNGIYLR